MPDNSNIFISIWNSIISSIGAVLGWFFDFLDTFGATGLFIVVIVLFIFVSYVITGSSPSSDKVSSKTKTKTNEK